MFIPTTLEEVGCSATPWNNLDVDSIQRCMNLVYPQLGHVVEKGDALEITVSECPFPSLCSAYLPLTQTNARVMTFRNLIGTTALIYIKAFLDKFKTPERVEEYVKSGIIYYGEIPFLFRVFEPTAVRSSSERGGYKVVGGFSS